MTKEFILSQIAQGQAAARAEIAVLQRLAALSSGVKP